MYSIHKKIQNVLYAFNGFCPYINKLLFFFTTYKHDIILAVHCQKGRQGMKVQIAGNYFTEVMMVDSLSLYRSKQRVVSINDVQMMFLKK